MIQHIVFRFPSESEAIEHLMLGILAVIWLIHGMSFLQLVFTVTYLVFYFINFIIGAKYIAFGFLIGPVLIKTYLFLKFEEIQFKDLLLVGPYKVGYKEFNIQPVGNIVSVFYPIDEEEHVAKNKNFSTNPLWLRHGAKSIEGLHNLLASKMKTRPLPVFVNSGLLLESMYVVMDANLSKDFLGKEKSLVPIIFSHGYGLARYFYTALFREIVSHGYIVFAIDHSDGTCTYSQLSNGVNLMMKNDVLITDLETKK
mmetsp:Transcript_13559/g.13292  ORF Transcript_13559/g.13292 Transcript_13559/m.13292 type:complete len:255 (+) Transcript_13559:32-796(+)